MLEPYDLSISMGIAEQFRNPVFWKAVDRVIHACSNAGIAAGIQFGSMEFLRESQNAASVSYFIPMT